MTAWIGAVMQRELKTLRREVEAYPSDADLWRVVPGISNPGGNLVLHLAGNLQYYVGAVLGGTGYVRHRDAEFAERGLPRAHLLAEIDRALGAVEVGMARLDGADLDAPYPEVVGDARPTTGAFLVHLAVHLAYHLGQVDYHRRIITGDRTTVKAIAIGELTRGAKP